MFRSILIILFTAVAIATMVVANFGSFDKSTVLSKIFQLEVDFSQLNATELFHVSDSSSSDDDLDLGSVGLNDVYILGMYGYCRGTANNNNSGAFYTTNFDVTSCTKPKAMYQWDPSQFIVNELKHTTGFEIPASDITLPTEVKKYVTTYKRVASAVYITSWITIGLSFIVFLAYIILILFRRTYASVHLGWIEWLSFLAALICSGGSTGTNVYIRSKFNDVVSTYGIHCSISNDYMILTWVGTVLTLISAILLQRGGCCCFRGRRQKQQQQQQSNEQQTFYPMNNLQGASQRNSQLGTSQDVENRYSSYSQPGYSKPGYSAPVYTESRYSSQAGKGKPYYS